MPNLLGYEGGGAFILQVSRRNFLSRGFLGFTTFLVLLEARQCAPKKQSKGKSPRDLIKSSGMAHPPLNEFVKFGKKILGAGINYRSLIAARNLPIPKEPIIFFKCSTSYITEGHNIIVPHSFNLHQEVELGVVIGKVGKHINENEAFDYVGGYCLALDMTEAGLMTKSRKEGLPWTLGKAFDTACPVSRFISKNELPNPEDIRIFSKVNNKMEQDSSTSDLLFTIPKLISFISHYITLEPGDLILTGSPAGAGPVQPGDVIECGIGDILTMKFPVKSA